MLKLTVEKFEEAKKFVILLGDAYQVKFDKTLGKTVKLRDNMLKENQTVYYDTIPPAD